MKRHVIFLILASIAGVFYSLLIASYSHAQVSHVLSHSEALGINGGTTTGQDTTGVNLIVIGISCAEGGPEPTLTDNKGNSGNFNQLTPQAVVGDPEIRTYYIIDPAVGSGHTFTVGGSGVYAAVTIMCFSGVDSYDKENGNSSTATASLQTGSVTPAVDDSLIVTFNNFADPSTEAINSSFTIGDQVDYGGTPFAYGSAGAYLIQGTAAAVNPTWSGNTVKRALSIAVFAPSAGGSTNPNPITPSIPGGTPDPLKRGPIP